MHVLCYFSGSVRTEKLSLEKRKNSGNVCSTEDIKGKGYNNKSIEPLNVTRTEALTQSDNITQKESH